MPEAKLRSIGEVLANREEGSIFGLIGTVNGNLRMFTARKWNDKLERWCMTEHTWMPVDMPATVNDFFRWQLVVINQPFRFE